MIYDISPRITPALRVFPGDTPMSREVLLDIERGDHIRLSTLRGTVHLGAHLDAPSHYGRDGVPIDGVPLERGLGPCRVMHLPDRRGGRIGVDDLTGPIDEERLLLATGTFPDPDTWNDDYAGLEPALVDHLAAAGVTLVGVDTPSVDIASSKDLLAHARCLAGDVLILEGLVLADVPDGRYELIALPLRLVGFDASPVRAVLRDLQAPAQARASVRPEGATERSS